jgi:hypothetical protein
MGAMLDAFKLITVSYVFMVPRYVPAEEELHPAHRTGDGALTARLSVDR